MRARKLFITSGGLFIIGLVSVWSKWNGTAGVSAGSSMREWAVNFCGSVNGWPALIGIASIIAALFVFLAAVISGAAESPRA
jgi:hypothetical protein